MPKTHVISGVPRGFGRTIKKMRSLPGVGFDDRHDPMPPAEPDASRMLILDIVVAESHLMPEASNSFVRCSRTRG